MRQVSVSTHVGWFRLFPRGSTKPFSYINSSIRSRLLSSYFRNQSYLKLAPSINRQLLSWAVYRNDGLYCCHITDPVTVPAE